MSDHQRPKTGNRTAKQQLSEETEATLVRKRVITMKDGRYMIFYTFPEIDRDAAQFRTNDSSRTT